jgi:diaminopimelate decarboxylase
MIQNSKLLSLAKEYGTPLYVYDGDMVVNHYKALFEYIKYDDLHIHYAMKANYHPVLLTMLRDAGCGIDAVSPAEVLLALRIGFAPSKIIYTANNMTDAEVDRVAATGVLFNIDSLSRLKKFGERYPGREVCLRFNPDVVDGDSAMTVTAGDLTKFGILLDDADKAKAIADGCKLKVVGLHSHTGSGLQHSDSVYRSMRKLMSIATPERFADLRFMDFGGGFKVNYRPDDAPVDYLAMGRGIVELFEEFCKSYGKKLELHFEPGKYMVAESGTMLVEINTVKTNRERLIAGCNSGFPQLIRPVLYGAYHQITNLSHPDGRKLPYDICGNICESGDKFAESREISEISEGDILAIGNAGAYCFSMGGVYNLRTMPAEAVVSDDKVISFRARKSDEALIEEIISMEPR